MPGHSVQKQNNPLWYEARERVAETAGSVRNQGKPSLSLSVTTLWNQSRQWPASLIKPRLKKSLFFAHQQNPGVAPLSSDRRCKWLRKLNALVNYEAGRGFVRGLAGCLGPRNGDNYFGSAASSSNPPPSCGRLMEPETAFYGPSISVMPEILRAHPSWISPPSEVWEIQHLRSGILDLGSLRRNVRDLESLISDPRKKHSANEGRCAGWRWGAINWSVYSFTRSSSRSQQPTTNLLPFATTNNQSHPSCKSLPRHQHTSSLFKQHFCSTTPSSPLSYIFSDVAQCDIHLSNIYIARCIRWTLMSTRLNIIFHPSHGTWGTSFWGVLTV